MEGKQVSIIKQEGRIQEKGLNRFVKIQTEAVPE
jgi:hypothetical protein